MNFTWIIALIGLTFGQLSDAKLYEVNEGSVDFRSDAPLELIEASSTELKGLINAEERTFESKHYPNATFSGKIIENINFTKDGLYTVRAKGQLNVHGIKRERIIRSELQVEEGQIEVHANFTVLLAEHDISIPKIVHQKIAEEIAVEIRAVFLPKMP